MQIRVGIYIVVATILLFFVQVQSGRAQNGGKNTFAFSNLSLSARAASLGGLAIATNDGDLNLAIDNPSLLHAKMSHHLVLNYVNYFSDVGFGYTGYALDFENVGTFNAGIQFIDYGDFIHTDETSQILGEFTASEYKMNISWGRKIDTLFSIGASLNFIYSFLYNYTSTGAGLDIAALYTSYDKSFHATILARNLGSQLKTYSSSNIEDLPLEVQFGIAKRLHHVPFRISVVAHNLQVLDLVGEESVIETDPFTDDLIIPKKKIGDKIMRHFILGGEFLVSKNLNVRLGYNYKRRQELKLSGKPGTIGFSWGFGMRISKFDFSYGRAAYHFAGASNHLSVTTNMSEFYSLVGGNR